MTQDIKLTPNSYGGYSLSIENGELAKTSGLDTAIYLSIYSKARANASLVNNPLLREGCIATQFQEREIGSLAWVYLTHGVINNETIESLQNEYEKALEWLINDNIANEVNVSIEKITNGLQVNIIIETNSPEGTREYNLVINT